MAQYMIMPLTTIGKILSLLTTREKTHLYLILVAQVGLAFIDMAGVASIMPFIAVVANPDVIRGSRWLELAYDSFGFTSIKNFLLLLGMLVLGLLIVSNLSKAVITWLTLKYDNRLYHTLARRMFASYLARPYEFFLSRNAVDLKKNVLEDVRMVIAGILSSLMQVVSGVLVALFILALLLAVNPSVAVTIALVIGLPYGVIYLVAARHLTSIGQVQWETNRIKHNVVSEGLSSIKDLKILGGIGVFVQRFSSQAQRHSQVNVTAGLISQIPRFLLETIAFGGILLIVVFKLGSEQSTGGIMSILALYAFAAYRMLPAIQQIFAGISTIHTSLPALETLHRNLKADVVTSSGSDWAEIQKLQPLPFTHALQLRDVVYSYPGTREFAVRGLNLTIVPNTSIGLVGTTGSGKTTIADLILGLLTPTSGLLLADDIEINSDNVTRWQRNLGYVPQHIFLSDDTITRNIAFATPEQEIDRAAVIHAARIANLHTFIEEELPDGYETVIGERGVRLSGGQCQRIGIARALYHNPALLIMDEATSALDTVTEESFIEALRTLSGEKTIMIIAHRLTTVKDCDVIYLMENGQIISQGTYDELLESSAWFKAATRTGT